MDKIIYNVKDDPLGVNNNLYYLMPKIHLISLSGSEQVQLKGSQSFIALVNGKNNDFNQTAIDRTNARIFRLVLITNSVNRSL